ncbi:MAG: Ig-like domain-containing protein [Candidatus Muiribacteriota bacterium]
MLNKIKTVFIFLFLLTIFCFCREPLQVISVSPLAESDYVPLNSNIEVTFNHELLKRDLNNFTFTVNDGYTDISGEIKYFKLLKKAVFIPAEKLTMNRTYKVTLSAGIRDLYGDRLRSSVIWTFSTGRTRDKTRPFLVSANPHDGYDKLDITPEISLIFSERIDPEAYNNIKFKDKNNKEIEIDVFEGKSSTAVSIRILEELKSEKTYTLLINSNIKDENNNKSGMDYKISYTTLDNIPPTIIETIPEPDQRKVNINSRIRILVDDELDIDTINESNIALYKDKEKQAVILNFDYESQIIEIIPEEPLQDSSFYDVYLKEGIVDKAHNPLEPYHFEFKTEDLTPPYLTNHFPEDGAENIDINTIIKLKFSEIIDKDSLENGIVITDGDKIIPYSFEINKYGVNVEVKPDFPLDMKTDYRISLKNTIKDLEGNSLENIPSFGFKTILYDTQEIMTKLERYSEFDENQAMKKIQSIIDVPFYENFVPEDQVVKNRVRDRVSPRTVDIFPENKMKNVPLNSKITIITSKNINPSTVRNGIIISDGVHNKIFSFSWEPEFNKLEITPESSFKTNTEYRVIITDRVKDEVGNPFISKEWRFNTASASEDILIASKLPEAANKIQPELLVEEVIEMDKKTVEEIHEEEKNEEETEPSDSVSERAEWVKEIVLSLGKKFAKHYEIMTTNPDISVSRYELGLIVRNIINQIHENKLNHVFRHKKGVKDIILLFQATVELQRELEILGVDIPEIEEKLKNRGIPVEKIREDLYKGILREIN